MPIESFARTSRPQPKQEEAPVADDSLGVIQGLSLPVEVAIVEYPRQCRIRRVRVLAPADESLPPAPGPVIVSRRALGKLREAR